MIGSWTDLSMMGAPLADIVATAGPLPLAVSTTRRAAGSPGCPA